ncbi:hypothetical protein [Pelagibius sp.]|uniref:hypothetical protein n=1 Tax=Pelagibius sp. TaxID=1931238 RepID=UPI002607FA27|nr:hypothetical protein [Pelagibius sp.]
MSIRVAWHCLLVAICLVLSIAAFPRATEVSWITTAEARPIPPRLAIAPERLSLTVTNRPAAEEAGDQVRLGP